MLKIYRFLAPAWIAVAAALVLVFFQSLADLWLPTLMSEIINQGVLRGNTAAILERGGFMLLVAAGGVACALAAAWLSARIALGLGRDLRSAVFRKVSAFSLEEYDRFGASTLITRCSNDIVQVQNVTVMILRMMVAAPLMMAGGIIMASREDAGLTWVLGLAVPVLLLIIIALARFAMPLFQSMQGKIDRLNLVLREKLTGIRVIRAFTREARERRRFEDANADLTATYIKVNRIMAVMMPAIMLVMNLTTLAILWFGIARVDSGDTQIGSLMAFTQYAVQILFSLMMLSMVFIMVPRAASAAKRIDEVLAVDPSIRDPEPAAAAPAPAGVPAGLLEFRNVSFGYPGAEQQALENVSFTARPGTVTAIIGSTGAGKSTLLNLIPRFHDASAGQVLVGGRDVRAVPQAELRSRIGLVPQKAQLFTGSVAENIRQGKPEASDAEVHEALRVAQAADFVGALEGGVEHAVAQGGANLSGGQKQRLAIARAVVRKPDIYLFDDSFSALDFATDRALRTALKASTRDATVLIVAQRVGTIRDADSIIVLDEGKVVGQGTHRELLAGCPAYQEIVASQFDQEERA